MWKFPKEWQTVQFRPKFFKFGPVVVSGLSKVEWALVYVVENITVKFEKIQTQEIIAVIVLKYKQCFFMMEDRDRWAVSWQNQQNECAPSEDSDQPGHLPRLNWVFGICPGWSESSLCTQWVAKEPVFLHADSEDSDQTGRMPRLIWVFTGRRAILLVLSCRGSDADGMANSVGPHLSAPNRAIWSGSTLFA